MYLANCTMLDIAYVVNLLARFSAKPTKQHWNGAKHILRYLKGTEDLGLFYKVGEDSNIKDMWMWVTFLIHVKGNHKHVMFSLDKEQQYLGNEQSRALRQHPRTTQKSQPSMRLPANAFGLRLVDSFSKGSCGFLNVPNSPTMIFEDNATYIAKIKANYIKGDRIKHILPKFFFTS